MATRSTIALEFADGTVQQVYCHWDGYLENNGAILQGHYVDPFKVRELIDLGDISSLRTEIGEKHDFSRLDSSMPAEEYETKYGHMTTFYGRDRGEAGTVAKTFKDVEDYKQNGQQEEYDYLLRTDGAWYVRHYNTSGKWLSLVQELLEVKALEDA